MKKLHYFLSILLILLLVLLPLFASRQLPWLSSKKSEALSMKEYSKHYVMIAENGTTSFWKTVFESAKAQAEEDDIYLEQIGLDLPDDYSISDYLRISIDSKVDGIIICPDGSANVTTLINEADIKGIPVVTVINDATESNRRCFVGINAYELGLTYGNQILQEITDHTKNIFILFHTSQTNTRNDMVFNQIKMTINDALGENHKINIQPYSIDRETEFDSEEAIRDLFVNSKVRPDILVCMDELDTECASQAVVDYNCVGDVSIIGYYSSDTVLNAIQKDIVAATVAMDTNELGRYSITALEEYEAMGYVSDYLSVDLHKIRKDNVEQYLSSEETESEKKREVSSP